MARWGPQRRTPGTFQLEQIRMAWVDMWSPGSFSKPQGPGNTWAPHHMGSSPAPLHTLRSCIFGVPLLGVNLGGQGKVAMGWICPWQILPTLCLEWAGETVGGSYEGLRHSGILGSGSRGP